MRATKRFLIAVAAVVAAALAPHAAQAHGWELGIAGIGQQNVEIRKCSTGALITTVMSLAANPGYCGSNLLVSFNSADGGAQVTLEPDVQYVFTFQSWGKSAFVIGSIGNAIANDDVWGLSNNSSPPVWKPNGCTIGADMQWVGGWPNAACATPPPPPPPLSVNLVIDHTVPQGSKTTYYLVATASGGTGTHNFSWSNATLSSAANVNPSTATRTILNSQSATVTVTVTRGTQTATRSIQLGGL
ncbi:MAG: hypothetical protein HOP12_03395 [Candidatus Eisenbacteria bacterium]|uniref:Uncharacterized protein n=1 Tax=Eiseniibacteriota bacterium TaxID=2212470 RepID=A0A849SMV2_UNCEI|nr:hypothetical protein [Candidatus Eisenbacteria bacterium]